MASELAPEGEAVNAVRRRWSNGHQWRLLGLVAGAIIVVVFAIWLGRRLLLAPPGTGEAPPPAGTFRPTAEQFKTLSVESVVAKQFADVEVSDGSIAFNGDLTTPVFSPYSGRVTQVIARPGDVLRRGAPLAAIDSTELVQAQNDLAAAQAQANLARTNEARKHALFDARGGSLQDWQQSQADLATAEGALRAVRNRLLILGKTEKDMAAPASDNHMDASAILSAPIAGVVVDRQVGPGQFVQSGSGTPLFTLADVSSVWLVANVREEDAPLMHKGQAVEVNVAALPGRTFRARLTYVAAAIDPNTHRLPVRAEIPNPDGVLKPEMFAGIRIVTDGGVESAAVPEGAVVYDGAEAHVWVVQEDAKGPVIGIRPIKVGRTDSQSVQVLDGLKVGERIVTRGSLFIDRAVAGS